ncbi:MAG: hypothetical protein LBH74_06980, partial [Nitrososphaerota archaeon]|nr:hypothetical protein [Nitrososphaerota archaeon]
MLSNNTASSNGGGVYSTGSFTLSGSVVSNNTALTGHGGGIYHNSSSPLNISNATICNNLALNGDGGGIWIARANLANLTIDSSGAGSNKTVFLDNVASRPTNRLPAADGIYATHIFTSHWSNPLKQGYNNYDISYSEGSLFIDLDVIFKIISLDSSGAYETQWIGTIEDTKVVQPDPVDPSGLGGYPVGYCVPLWYEVYNNVTNVFSGVPWDFSVDVS